VERLEADPRLTSYRYLSATKADMLRRLDRSTEAALAYREALALADNAAEKRFLVGRLNEVTAAG
jgi:RNA polymerase sigma-70 factor, ECF subfamily